VIVSLVKFSKLCTKNIAKNICLWYLFTRPQKAEFPRKIKEKCVDTQVLLWYNLLRNKVATACAHLVLQSGGRVNIQSYRAGGLWKTMFI
jgi:hypothetical protein